MPKTARAPERSIDETHRFQVAIDATGKFDFGGTEIARFVHRLDAEEYASFLCEQSRTFARVWNCYARNEVRTCKPRA